MARPAVFIDRDGTLNVEKKYLHRFEDWEWIPGAIEAVRKFNTAGFLVIVVSNQAGVARGLYSESDVVSLHARVDEELDKAGARIDAYYFCPHHPEYAEGNECACRKPLPGMLVQAREELNIDFARSWMIGDKLIDIQAGQAAGIRSILVATGYGASEVNQLPQGVPFVEDLLAASDLILGLSQ